MSIVIGALLVVAIVLFSIPLFLWIAERRAAASRSLPPIFFPMSPSARDSIDMAQVRRAATPPKSATPATPATRSPSADPRRHTNGHSPVPALDEFDEQTPVSAETIRFIRPAEDAVQLLPGRLEVLAGDTAHREIRFVRIPGEPLLLFVGRDAGRSPQYVGLGSPTVSRRHARFAYANGRWMVKNLSQTNPLVVNDDELTEADEERALVDGDRLELGDVVLRFHAH